MRLIIAGGREFTNEDYMVDSLNRLIEEKKLPPESEWEIVSGMARGADSIAANLARSNGIKLKCFPAHWELHGKKAGFIRNIEMGEYADMLVAFWNGYSRGTEHMIKVMRSYNKPYIIIDTAGL